MKRTKEKSPALEKTFIYLLNLLKNLSRTHSFSGREKDLNSTYGLKPSTKTGEQAYQV